MRHLIGCDSRGAVHTEREDYLDCTMHTFKRGLAERAPIQSIGAVPRPT